MRSTKTGKRVYDSYSFTYVYAGVQHIMCKRVKHFRDACSPPCAVLEIPHTVSVIKNR